VLTIDGAMGEGGGQIIRTSLALSLVTGEPVEIRNIRAGRPRPGLRRQHLTAVTAAGRLSEAEVEGAQLGSRRLRFQPGRVKPGSYRFDVGTAGSTTLVLQTVLPALLTAGGPSQLVLEGGTHNPMAPPFEFLAKTYLPLIARLGPRVEAVLERPGFYPAGGGRLRVAVTPARQLGRLELVRRGPLIARRGRVLLARLPEHIARRECSTLAAHSGWEPKCFVTELVRDSPGPGNVVMIEIESETVTEVFTAFGRKGVPAEQVAAEVWSEASRYLQAEVPVGPHLADQLMLPLAIGAHQGSGGGQYRTLELTSHSRTHLELLDWFLQVDIEVESPQRDDVCVRIGPRR